MSTRTKRSLLVLAALFLLAQIVLLPRFVRWIDGRVQPKFAEAAKFDAQYREMTNVFPIAAESPPGHPTLELWKERRAALMAAGYIETRVIRMKSRPNSKGWVDDFFRQFVKRFPGLERTVRPSSDAPPTVEVTARVTDFRAIERFVENYQSPK